MNTSHSPERFHALDATRAFALLLGVAFHAAWSFIPHSTGGPVVDVSGSGVFDWFFFTSHTFRMQLFFLIAGFFGRMLCEKKGVGGFVRHRLLRIGVPLVVGWFILAPSIIMIWTWGGNVSGRNLVPVAMPILLKWMFDDGLLFVSKARGGMFGLMHLWFLYYLLWLCFLAIVFRRLLAPLRLLWRADAGLARLVRTRWILGFPALFIGSCLWRMEGWLGTDTPMNSLWPSIPVLLVYGTFFGAGWLLHRQAGLLREMRPHWKWHLGAGVALSIPLFATYHYLSAWRVAQPAVALSPQYPLISPAQVSDWPRFLTALQAMNQDDSPELRNFWWHFSAGQRTALESLRGLPDPEVQGGICIAINKLLAMPGVFASPTQKNLTGNVTGKVTPPGSTLSRNRRQFDTLFHETAGQDPHLWRWFRPVKLIYSVVYALVSCMLVFGTLGCFQEFCAGHNPVWRYISDSAYWIYLVHLPLVAALQVWMRGWAWPGAEKCLLLTLIAFAVLFASYHYLVRSTFIGLVLNGQRYPFRPLPWKIKPRSSLRPSEVVSVIGMTRE